jgi:hypothetical protein
MATQPGYSPYLEYSPTFKWGGRTWSAQDRSKFEKYLRSHGVKPQQFYARHPVASKTFDPVEGQLYGLIQPQLTGIAHERQMAADLWNRRMQNLTGFSAALMPYLQQVPGNINAPYIGGADAVESASGGFGQRLNDDTAGQASKANDVLGSINAPAGQMQSGGDPGGVLAGMGGMEAALMRASGAKFANAAAQLPKTASLEQLQAMKDLQNKAGEADAGFSSDILQVLQGLPAARAQIQKQATSDRLDQQKAALAQIKFEADQHYKNAMLALYSGDRKRYAAELKLAQQKENRYAQASAGLLPDGNPRPGYHLDPSGTVAKDGWHINPQTGIPVKDKSPGTKGSAAKTSPGAKDVRTVAQYQDDIDRYISKLGHEADPAEAASRGVPAFSTVYPDYKTAYARLWARFKNTVSTPKGQAALKAAIIAALAAAGIAPVQKPKGHPPPYQGGTH